MSDITNTPTPRPTVALIGLGTMGAGIAERLLDQGFAVNVWNRTSGPAARLAERGAMAHARPDQAVDRADVVVTMLPTADSVKEVMVEQRTLDFIRPGAVWAQMGTIGVEATETLASEVASAYPDVAFVDAPVSGSREPARDGRLLILASGPARA
ncbi:MAG TPA: NAD(P)-binding domain-containing protein, partial [Candidatus Dormibacteraeota bacterium]